MAARLQKRVPSFFLAFLESSGARKSLLLLLLWLEDYNREKNSDGRDFERRLSIYFVALQSSLIMGGDECSTHLCVLRPRNRWEGGREGGYLFVCLFVCVLVSNSR